MKKKISKSFCLEPTIYTVDCRNILVTITFGYLDIFNLKKYLQKKRFIPVFVGFLDQNCGYALVIILENSKLLQKKIK